MRWEGRESGGWKCFQTSIVYVGLDDLIMLILEMAMSCLRRFVVSLSDAFCV